MIYGLHKHFRAEALQGAIQRHTALNLQIIMYSDYKNN